MRLLVVDARTIRPGMTGVGTWSLELTRALGRLAVRRGDWNIIALALEDAKRRPEGGSSSQEWTTGLSDPPYLFNAPNEARLGLSGIEDAHGNGGSGGVPAFAQRAIRESLQGQPRWVRWVERLGAGSANHGAAGSTASDDPSEIQKAFQLLREEGGGRLCILPVPFDYQSHPSGDYWYYRGGLHRLLRRTRAHAFFSPWFLAPWSAPCPSIATLLDFIPWRIPGNYSWKFRLYVKTAMRIAAWRADALAVISRSVARDARAFLDVPARKMFTMYPAASRDFRPVPEGERMAIQMAWRLPPPPYFVCIGAIEPRKNLAVLVRAMERLREAGRKDVNVLWVGREAPGGERDLEILSRSPARPQFVWRSRLPSGVLAAALTGSNALVFPSAYEGFGIPAVEAMACGAPVIASRAGALPEVVGNAGLLVRPGSSAELAAAMRKILDAPASSREILRERALLQASRFSYDRTAEKLLNLAGRLSDQRNILL